MSEEEEEGIDPALFESELKVKIDNYFSAKNNELLSYENLDDFLKEVELYDFWNSEEEKDTLWQSFMKYGKDDKVDAEGAKKGMHDLLNKEEETTNNLYNETDNNFKDIKENKDTNLLTRISRISIKNEGSGGVNKLVLNKYKQKAIEEYDCLDNETLIKFKKIFLLLNINENNKNIIPVERIEQLISKHKFITLDKLEIVKYLHFLSCDDKPIEEITSININNTIYMEIDSLLQEKIGDEELDNFEEDGSDEVEQNDPLDILEEIQHKIEATKENSSKMKEMKNQLIKINKKFTEAVTKIIQDYNEENQQENINTIEEMGIDTKENINRFDEYLNNLSKDQKINIQKLHSLRNGIVHIQNEMKTLREDYRDICQKYNNNQELELDDEMERLLDENVALNQEINTKKEEIEVLINERAEKSKEINELYIQLDEAKKSENDLKKQVTELKLAAIKSKEEYDNLMDNVLNKMEKKENEELMERNRIKEMIEKQLENEENKKDGEDKNQNDKLNIKALNDIDNMNISLTDKLIKKKKILSQLSSEQLMEYTLKLERLNISLKSEKNKKDKKIKELEEKLNQSNKTLSSNKKEIGSLNIEIKKLQNIISSLKTEVKQNEVFRPSVAMNSQMRISRMSKLNTAGLNAMKFKEFNIENKTQNINDYFKNNAFNIEGKKQLKTTKLKDKNINYQVSKEQNIINTMYDEEDNKIVEEQNEEEIEQNVQKNKADDNNKENNNVSDKKDENVIGGQNGIEFNIESNVEIPGEEGGEIIIDNINDINLGGSTKELFEVKKKENTEENEEKKDNENQNKPINPFFESKPMENNFEISGEKNEENINIVGERETIQVNNNNQMVIGGLEDVIISGMDNYEEAEEEEENIAQGRESEKNTKKKNELQMSKYGMDIGGRKRKQSAHDNNIKSSGDIMQGISSKDKLEEVANTIEGNQINIDNNNNKLEINKNNQINIPMSKTIKEDNLDFQISTNNNNININEKSKEKLNIEISKSNIINIENNNKNNIPNVSLNTNKIEISSQNNIPGKGRAKSEFTFQHVSNTNFEGKGKQMDRTLSQIKKAEIENNNYDYYSLFHEQYVLNKFREKKDNANEKNIYSDQIYLLNGKKLEKRLILLTPSYVYIIDPKEAIFILIMEKSEIEKIAISNQNLNILIFMRKKAQSIILLTLRRMDLLNFLKEHYHNSKKPIRFIYEDSFTTSIKGKDTKLSVKDKIFTTLSNFDGAIKIGYLQKMNPNPLFFKSFSERLVVLTSIGLIVFNDPTKPPERLYPIIGSKILKALGNKYKKPNCFEILTPNGETKVFSAYKERELNAWIEEFEKVKKDFRNKMKKLDTVNKMEFIDNNLYNVKEEENED